MTFCRHFAAILLLLPLSVHAKPAALVTLTAAPQPMTSIVIKKTALTVRVALGFERALVLNLAPAQSAKLKAFPLLGKQKVKNKLIPGGEAVVRGNFYDVAAAGTGGLTTPTVWIDRQVEIGSAGIISVMAIDADRVVILQPSAPTGGKTYAITTTGKGEVGFETQVSGQKISVRLALDAAQTVMSAAAAAALEDSGLIKRAGSVGLWQPFPGIALPIENLRPTQGARLIGLPLIAPSARITEERARELDARASAGTSTVDDEADAIVVTGSRNAKKERAWVLIGRDMLDQCSRLEIDKPGKRWLLTCAFAG